MDVDNVVLVKKFEEKLNNFGRVIITKNQLKRDLTLTSISSGNLGPQSLLKERWTSTKKKTKKRFRGFSIVNY